MHGEVGEEAMAPAEGSVLVDAKSFCGLPDGESIEHALGVEDVFIGLMKTSQRRANECIERLAATLHTHRGHRQVAALEPGHAVFGSPFRRLESAVRTVRDRGRPFAHDERTLHLSFAVLDGFLYMGEFLSGHATDGGFDLPKRLGFHRAFWLFALS